MIDEIGTISDLGKSDLIGGDIGYDEPNARVGNKGPDNCGSEGMEEGYGANEDRGIIEECDRLVGSNLDGRICPFSLRGSGGDQVLKWPGSRNNDTIFRTDEKNTEGGNGTRIWATRPEPKSEKNKRMEWEAVIGNIT